MLEHFQVLSWIDSLQWYDSGSVSCVELAIDYEADTGHRLCQDKGATITERARKFRARVRKLNKTCQDIGKEKIIPGDDQKKVHTLRSVGGPPSLGYACRPKFKRMATTRMVLETQITKAIPRLSAWGTDICPDYSKSETNRPKKKRKTDPSDGVVT